ncbi:MAG: purine-nucleoside phosphorylase [Candidatus Hatepunaea meridiana]|nr:purine-nucleoside phosphorylase [Candidatus Hatepunaea meridiana]
MQKNHRNISITDNLYEQIEEAVSFIKKLGFKENPDAFLIFGSGLGAISSGMNIEIEVPYGKIPGFVDTTLDFHKGRLLYGEIAGRSVIAMDGRFHYYEGYTMQEITFPVRVMRMLGAKNLIISNISGGLNPEYAAGDIVVIVDQINLMGDNPLIGINDERLGLRFPDMMEPYNRKLISLTEKHAMKIGYCLSRGVYAAMSGPSFETRAEYRMLRTLGADMIGMSSVPEVIVAVHGGMRVIGLSLISDDCFPECLEPLDIEVLLKRAEDGSEVMGKIIEGVLGDEEFPVN